MTTDKAVLSVDFELFTHTPAYRGVSGSIADETLGLDAWPFLRELLAEHDATATFFVVAEVAQQYPDTIASIADAGHEIASHTLTHPLLTDLPQDEQRMELQRSRTVLEDVTGETVNGFRAPAFKRPAGFFPLLDDVGYTYDSSIVPARKIPGWYGGEYSITEPCSMTNLAPGAPDIYELPLSIMPGIRLPLSGAWTRLLGRRYTLLGLELLRRSDTIPVLYTHPWELVELPSVEGLPKRVSWRTGEWMRETFRQILSMEYEFVPASSVVGVDAL
ncbi:polysaccharide deacetylase family protein [Natronomonas amylolytica]|uniref:polysaccharide deacetylase family protein n=1 Tax=Natronomonas amylolytica TaxID=3108498 RepID=UPI003009EA8A